MTIQPSKPPKKDFSEYVENVKAFVLYLPKMIFVIGVVVFRKIQDLWRRICNEPSKKRTAERNFLTVLQTPPIIWIMTIQMIPTTMSGIRENYATEEMTTIMNPMGEPVARVSRWRNCRWHVFFIFYWQF